MRSIICGGMAALVALVMAVGPARAQESAPLTIESLKEKLEQLGYDYKEYKNSEGKVVDYTVYVKRDGRRWALVVSLSGSKQWLYVSAYGAKLKNPTVPPMILEKMLEVNDVIAPATFVYAKKISYFLIQTPVLNTGGISNRVLKDRLEYTVTVLSKYEGLWNPSKWPTGAPTPEPGPAPR